MTPPITIEYSEAGYYLHLAMELIGWLTVTVLVSIWVPMKVKRFIEDIKQAYYGNDF